MHHPALAPFANKALSLLFSDDNRLNVLAARLERSLVCPDLLAYHPTSHPHIADDLLSLHYGKRAIYFTCKMCPVEGIVVLDHAPFPFTPRASSYALELVPPFMAYLARPFFLKRH